MKHSKLFILLIMVVMLLSGCTVKSNVVVKPSGKVEENVTVLVNTASLKNESYTIKQMIENIILDYSAALKYRKYEHNVVQGADLSGAQFTKTYGSICSYFADTGFNQHVYRHVKCTEDKDYVTIENDTDYIPYCQNCSDWPALQNVEFNITLPVKAVESSADSVNNNIYTWMFNESSPSNKIFYLKMSKEELNKSYITEQRNVKTKSIVKTIGTVLLIIIILGSLGYLGIRYYKKYKDNQIEY